MTRPFQQGRGGTLPSLLLLPILGDLYTTPSSPSRFCQSPHPCRPLLPHTTQARTPILATCFFCRLPCPFLSSCLGRLLSRLQDPEGSHPFSTV